MINNWGPVVKWFQDMWDKLKPIIEWFTDSSGDTVDAINSAQWGAGAYDAYGTGIPARGYTLSGGRSGSVKQRLRCHRPESLHD